MHSPLHQHTALPMGGRRSSSLGRLRLLALANRALLFVCAAVGLTVAIMIGIKQTASYVSVSTVQLQNLNLAATSSDFAMFDFSVENDMKLRIENAAELLKKDFLLDRVAKAVQMHPDAEKILLPDPKLKNLMGVQRLVSATKLSRKDLMGAIADMTSSTVDRERNSIDISVRSRTSLTTSVIDKLMVEKFIEVTQIKTMERIEKTTRFFQDQLRESRRRLVEADERLSEFTQKNPYVLNDISRNEYVRLREKRQVVLDEIEGHNRLIGYYRDKIRDLKSTVTLPMNGVRTQLQSEIQQLEYDRLTYLSEGYSPTHPGIVKIDDKIRRLQDVISARINRDPAANPAVETDSAARLNEMATKILTTQDLVESAKITLKNIDARIKVLAPSFDVLPEREALFNRLKRDSDVTSQLYLQLSSHVNLMNVRTASENGNWSIISEPTAPMGPTGVIPLFNLIAFGIAIGTAVGFSFVLVREAVDPRLINRDDVESLGFVYSGRLSDNLSEQAEVLATMGQIGTFEASEEKQAIITVASPDRDMDLAPVQFMTSYLANQGYATLAILLGDIPVPAEYGAPVSIDFANIYRHPDGKRDLVQVSDRDTFVSLQNLITTSTNRYHAIYLMFRNPLANASYPLGLKMSNKLLLVGPRHVFTMESYHELTRGFKYRKNIFFAFTFGLKELVRRRILDEKERADASYRATLASGARLTSGAEEIPANSGTDEKKTA